MKTKLFGYCLLLLISAAVPFVSEGSNISRNELRAPAYPLVTIDPYISCWSPADCLYDSDTRHWSGQEMPMVGALRVDGIVYRFMGTDSPTEPSGHISDTRRYFSISAVQTSVDVQATTTTYEFICGPVELVVSFTAPFLPDNLELVSRPVNYISYEVTGRDSRKHDVSIYFEATPAWTSNTLENPNTTEGNIEDGFLVMKSGPSEQKPLSQKGDQIRVNWGQFCLSVPSDRWSGSVGSWNELRKCFADTGILDGNIDAKRDCNMAVASHLGKISKSSGFIMAGFDDVYSILYFGEKLRPYWNRNADRSIEDVLSEAYTQYDSLMNCCADFDRKLMDEATVSGGKKYAELCALAYRQIFAAHKLVQSPDGELMYFSKENASNGSIGTVDITYPSSPIFLYYNPELAKALMNHIFDYSESGRWTKPFPAHDVGTYPLANGQTYKHDMPVEESGNMLILTAAVSRVEGNTSYFRGHKDILKVWADYLVQNGLDPENQLCTDDFAGKSAHNANLSLKAILGIASYAFCLEEDGSRTEAEKYWSVARDMALQWKVMASDGDHYKLTFDQSGTWSMKYNLVWDSILGFNIFAPEIAETEIKYYLTRQNIYGLPLDSRRLWTKSDWLIWTATLSENKDTFELFIDPLWKFVNETKGRVPMSDWYKTDVPMHVIFKGRSVVGGFWMKLLSDRLIENQK